jgi:hypothetical protein
VYGGICDVKNGKEHSKHNSVRKLHKDWPLLRAELLGGYATTVSHNDE